MIVTLQGIAASVSWPMSRGADFLKDGAFGLSMKVQGDLADMNDSGNSFEEIADYIEKRL